MIEVKSWGTRSDVMQRGFEAFQAMSAQECTGPVALSANSRGHGIFGHFTMTRLVLLADGRSQA